VELYCKLFFIIFQFAKTFFNLMTHIAKDQTLQYILTILDDVLQVYNPILSNCYGPLINILFLLSKTVPGNPGKKNVTTDEVAYWLGHLTYYQLIPVRRVFEPHQKLPLFP